MRTLYIHQIYGLFEDGKSYMNNELFKESVMKWIYITTENNKNRDRLFNYQYILWDKKKCDNLIDKYNEFKEMYENTRFKIMKCDIMRFLILYHMGGIYADMDIIPRINNLDFLYHDSDAVYVSKYVNKNTENYDIEILSSFDKHNPLFYRFLKYIPSQILEKNNIKVYENWKIRYVFHTTGPHSFNRFIKNYDYPLKIIPLNTLSFEKGITLNNYDKNLVQEYFNITFYSFYSLSYNDDIHSGKDKSYKKKINI